MLSFCVHTSRLEHVDPDVASFAGTGQAVEEADTVSPFVSSLNERMTSFHLSVGTKMKMTKTRKRQRDHPTHRDLKPDHGGPCQHSEVVEGKATAIIIIDTTFDDFTDGRLFVKAMDRENIALVWFTTDGDVFGVFFIFAVTKQNILFFNPTMFAFSFETNGRCETPQRFDLTDGL